jgi:hypothetical protein
VRINNSVKLEPQNNDVCDEIRDLGSRYKCTINREPSMSPSGGGGSSTPISSTSSAGEGGLSTGAKVGIGVGVGIGVLLALLLAAFFIFRRRRTSRSRPRNSKADEWKFTSDKPEHSPVRYTKVPAVSDAVEETSSHSDHRPVSAALPENWTPPGQAIENPDGRAELEEQQGPRHEMDARSLPDIDLQEDDDEDTRSLQDIERAHRSTG